MTRRAADLHVHTTASDGLETPSRVVEVALARGLAAVGITDHDSVSGLAEALRRAAELGSDAPEVVPGVELDTDSADGEIHILGYFMAWDDPNLESTLVRLRTGRLQRLTGMLSRLEALGLPLSPARVLELAGGGSVGRPHVARAMVEAGYVTSVAEAFQRFLARGKPAYVERLRFTPREAVRAIRAAGGVPVLAHPGKAVSRRTIRSLVEGGLEGLEVYHPDHDTLQEQDYSALAAGLGLVATGGSDSHGPGLHRGAEIGEKVVDAGVVEELRRRAEAVRRSRGEGTKA